MGRNYFSQHGGPYFINDGFTKHSQNPSNPNIKPDKNLFYTLTLGFVTAILTIGVVLVFVF